MKNNREIEGWRAEQIAKVLLLNSGLVTLVPEYDNKFDFLAIGKNAPDKKFAVEVKATKHSKEEIKKVSSKIKSHLSKVDIPVLLMYINSDKEDGYFEVFKGDNGAEQEIQPLQPKNLEEKLFELMQ